MRKVVLPVWLGASLFMACVAASPAFASFEFTKSPTIAEGKNHVFTFGKAEVLCEKAVLEYSGKALFSEPTNWTPSYGSCKGFGVAVTVTVSHCQYELKAAQETETLKEESGTGIFKTPASLVNAAGECAITAKAGELCEVTMHAQSLHGEPETTDLKTEETLESETKMSEGEMSYTKKGGLCLGVGTGADGLYKGTVKQQGAARLGFILTAGAVAGGKTGIILQKFLLETESIECTEAEYEYPAINAAQPSLGFKPILMPPLKPCKTVNRNAPFLSAAGITATVTNCEMLFIPARRGRTAGIVAGADLRGVGGTGMCEIKLVGSNAGNNNCKREMKNQSGLVATLSNGATDVSFTGGGGEPWVTAGGASCAENEANGAHAGTPLSYIIFSMKVGGGLQVG